MTSNTAAGRMLLSHNFDLSPDDVPALSRGEFADVFCTDVPASWHCRAIAHPHWMVEIQFPVDQVSPAQVGDWCAQRLAATRHAQLGLAPIHTILILGGVKTTPPTSDSPNTLQPGNWGVDVVETASGDAFLQAIAWEATIASKPPDSIFKVELTGCGMS